MVDRDPGDDAPLAAEAEQPAAAADRQGREVCRRNGGWRTDARNALRGHGWTRGSRGFGAIPGHSERTQARSGSSEFAIVRRSPASALR